MLRSSNKASVLFGVYLPYLMFFALAPFTFHYDAGVSPGDLLVQRFEGMSSVWRLTIWDIGTNILFFLPFGFLFVLLPFILRARPFSKILLAASCAGLLSLAIELAQTFLPRHPSFADIACNILGAGLGSVLGIMAYPALVDRNARGRWCHHPSTSLGIAMVGYWVVLCMLFSFPLPLIPDFSNWDPDLRLHLGNETTLSQPWRGEMYGVTIYDRALSAEEVWTNFSAGPTSGIRTPPVGRGIVVRYDFAEGSGTLIHDRAESSHPVNLLIENPSMIRWLPPQGLAILGSTSISSFAESARPVHDRLYVSGEMSLESWISPAGPEQPGPDPFVSSSDRVDLRNFTLAQEARDLVFWLRTPLTGVNGRRAELRTIHQPLTAGLHHVIVTYAASIAALYLNGVEEARLVLEVKSALLDAIVDTIGSYYEWGLRSVFLFPLGVLSYLSLRRVKPTWMSYVVALACAGVVEMARALVLTRSVDTTLIAISVGTVFVASLAATHLFATDYQDSSVCK